MSKINHHTIAEHSSKTVKNEELELKNAEPRIFKTVRGNDYPVFYKSAQDDGVKIKANYYIGIDWLVKGEQIIQVEPKINTKNTAKFKKKLDTEEGENDQDKSNDNNAIPKNKVELNYLKMLLDVMSEPESAEECSNLILIDWEQQQIPIQQKKDQLTPFLVVQFLQLLRQIVRKGLKKSYYKKESNLRGKVKGKILVGQHLKKNVFKNKMTSTYCSYQVFGVDSLENRFLKKVFQFAKTYVENHPGIFNDNKSQIKQCINFCRPAFEQIGDLVDERTLKHLKYNPFFKEYKEAITIGKQILKKFAYNISKTAKQTKSTPPFWIDMPGLFELYFYAKLIKGNPQDATKIHFQFRTKGNALDFLISAEHRKMIIDTKYKLHYKSGKIHQDIRQVSGYARLKKVRNELDFKNYEMIDCLIIYPDIETGVPCDANGEFALDSLKEKMLEEKNHIKAYDKVYKLGISLPVLNPG